MLERKKKYERRLNSSELSSLIKKKPKIISHEKGITLTNIIYMGKTVVAVIGLLVYQVGTRILGFIVGFL